MDRCSPKVLGMPFLSTALHLLSPQIAVRVRLRVRVRVRLRVTAQTQVRVR